MKTSVLPWTLCFSVAIAWVGCKEEEEDPGGKAGDGCEPAADNAKGDCQEGLACEPAGTGDGHVCAAPLEIRGMVIDAITEAPIAGALVAALDESSAPVTDVVTTDAEGKYVLPVSARRDADGGLADNLRWTLNVSAQDYLPFPYGIRPAIPVDAKEAVDEGSGDTDGEGSVVKVIENPVTVVALIPLDDADAGGYTVSGVAGGDVGAGTLVVAEGGSGRTPYAIADASGGYTLFNVPSGMVSIHGYRVGVEFEALAVTVADADVANADLMVTSEDGNALGKVAGSLNIVNAAGGLATSVVLVPASVYNEVLERGPVPFGLRDPEPPLGFDVSSGYEIAGVPSGTYKVLPAFENDFLVRDPDLSIAGTLVQEVTVTFGQTAQVPDAFKVTEALEIIGPGKDGPERVLEAPTFQWVDDSSETHYEIIVYDALGTTVWGPEVIMGVSGGNVSLAYGGSALQSGMYYQFRVTSLKETPQGTTRITRTEDLRGVFVFGEEPSADTDSGG